MDKVRAVGLKILSEVWDKGAYANVALVQEMRRAEISGLDRRFLTELTYGAIKAGATLDWLIGRYVKRPLAKVDPLLRHILRQGFYQLFFMDKVPPSAAVNEAVNLAKRYSHQGGAGFVNGVMRTAVREPGRAALPTKQDAKSLALRECHPEWLVKRWLKEFGYETAEALCRFDNAPPPLSLRVNTLKTSRAALLQDLAAAGIAAKASSLAPEGILVETPGALEDWPPLQQGLCQAQDESSMLVAQVVHPKPGAFVIDACSAPGGKATHLAALMENRGKILAVDIHAHKLQRVAENAARLGIDIITTELLDAREIGEKYAESADFLLVDAPCSGLGVLRRRADARWRKSAAQIKELAALQRAILEGSVKALRPGGVLVYSTCTVTPEENRDLVAVFLESHPEFISEDTGEFLPQKRPGEKLVQLLPPKDGTDGFFIARMRRR
ncbi:MAG: 16S rRNA (cytosine(967)-C(5))-methyltransferase RsmB [Selenomonadaceae bacterium]|nr:16S rRNA (cytosine(967)-C(5))-methyltransferase RsmB [Selenomonadaceae bacterium]